MKRSEWKKQIQEKFPYPKLTIHGDMRIDQMLSTLPEKRGRVTQGYSPRHGRGDWEKDGVKSVGPVRQGWGRTVLNWSVGVVLLVFVSLVLLNMALPETAEQLPGLGNVFRSINGGEKESSLPEITPPPESAVVSDLESSPFPQNSPYPQSTPASEDQLAFLPVEDNGTKLLSIMRQEDELVITAEVPYMGRESWNLLHYNDSRPLGTYAQLFRPYDGEILLPYQVTFDDEPGGDLSQLQVRNEGRKTVTWFFGGELSLEEELVFSLLEHDGPLLENMPEDFPGNRVTAEFILDVEKNMAAPGCYAEKMGLQKPTPDEVRNTERNAPFIRGWYAAEPYVASVPEDDRRYPFQNYYKLVFFSDLSSDVEISLTARYLDSLGPNRVYTFTALPSEETQELGSPEYNAFLDEMSTPAWYSNGTAVYCDGETSQVICGKVYRRVVIGISGEALGIPDDKDVMSKYLNDGNVRFSLFYSDGTAEQTEENTIFADVADTVQTQLDQSQYAYSVLTGKTVESETAEVAGPSEVEEY